MPAHLEPDDDVSRFLAVWLGPDGTTLPWAARYAAYVFGAGLFLMIVTFKAIMPGLSVGIPPIWEVCFAVFGTTLLMASVDHDKSIAAVIFNIVAVARERPGRNRVERLRMRPAYVKRHTNRDPHDPHHHRSHNRSTSAGATAAA